VSASLTAELVAALQRGMVIPAHPLALTLNRQLDERRQRALTRYYLAAGAGGVAVGVHTTQFAIREARYGLYRPVLELAAEECTRADANREIPVLRVGGICGVTTQAVQEATLLRDLGYHAGLLSLSALRSESDTALLAHCQAVSQVIPLFGFYLQPAVGGRHLSYAFWRKLAETVDSLIAIKIAPFNRYQTLDVVRAIVDAGRSDIALYTGNDDNILLDLVTPYCFDQQMTRPRRIAGGLLGHWAVWTKQAVEQLALCQNMVSKNQPVTQDFLAFAQQVTDSNAVLFDAANGFAGCIPGIHEVLRRQGILENLVCLDEHETLSPGQSAELDRIQSSYPHLLDDDFVAEHRDDWLQG